MVEALVDITGKRWAQVSIRGAATPRRLCIKITKPSAFTTTLSARCQYTYGNSEAP